jgi:diguanylate cyclase (GGDEF)-like protein
VVSPVPLAGVSPAPPPAPPLGSRAGLLVASAGIVLCVGVADYLTGREVALILFYLGPIGIATWYAGLRGGIAMAILSAAVSTGADAVHEWSEVPHEHPTLPVALLAWNCAIQLGTFVSLVLVLSALRTRLLGEELLARTDALTQIPNRRAFFESAAHEIERARRSGRPLALAFVDIDAFKDVNDVLGHAEGDALLVTVAQTLRGATRAVDVVARLGGDEFALLLPETPPAEVEPLLSRVRAALLAAVAQRGWKVGFSIGAAVFVAPPASADELMARADELMYAAKRGGKGAISVAAFGAQAAVAAGRG